MIRTALIAALALMLTPAVARAQVAVETAFRDALTVTPLPKTLQAEQAEWLEWRAEVDPEELTEFDAERDAELRAGAAADRAMRGWSTSRANLGSGCPPIGIERCEVIEGGFLRRPLDEGHGETLHWIRLRGASESGPRAEGVVLLAGDDRLRPVAWSARTFWHEPPQVVERDGRTLIALPATHDGTGRMNADVLFDWRTDGAMIEIDQRPFREQLQAALPPGLEIWKGLLFRWPSLMAETSLWQANDGNCCPTGGEAWIDMRIEGDALVLGEFTPREGLLEALHGHSVELVTWAAQRYACDRAAGREEAAPAECADLPAMEADILAGLAEDNPERATVARIKAATPNAE
jgi:hypothetical protein